MTNLVQNSQCPVCRSADFTVHNASSIHSNYSRSLPNLLRPEEVEHFNQVQVRRCADCDSLYPSAWINAATANLLYSVVDGQHRFGWVRMSKLLNGATREAAFGRIARNFDRLVEHVGPVRRYAEVNCPFSGFLPVLRGTPETDFGGALNSVAIASAKRNATVPANRGINVPTDLMHRGSGTGMDVDLIRVASPTCWGANCTVSGLSCQAAASAAFNARPTDFAQIDAHGVTYDLIGFHHILDHLPDPQRILASALAASKHVFVITHEVNEWHSQHPFTLGARFFTNFRSDAVSVEEITRDFEPFTDDPTEPKSRIFLLQNRNGAISGD